MYDLHSHIIYGVDDGSPDEETSRELLRMASACGTGHIAATPHVIELKKHPSWERILEETERLRQLAAEEGLGLSIYPGAELEMNWELLELFEENSRAYCLGGSRYLLVELPAMTIPDYAEDFWYELELLGITPVLAHPERNRQLMEQPERLLKWMKSGLLAQCNGGSLTGKFGAKVQKNAELLLKNNMVHFLGSDAHRVKIRNTDLTEAVKRLTELVGEKKQQEICRDNPAGLFADKELHMELPRRISREVKQQSLWRKIFG